MQNSLTLNSFFLLDPCDIDSYVREISDDRNATNVVCVKRVSLLILLIEPEAK